MSFLSACDEYLTLIVNVFNRECNYGTGIYEIADFINMVTHMNPGDTGHIFNGRHSKDFFSFV